MSKSNQEIAADLLVVVLERARINLAGRDNAAAASAAMEAYKVIFDGLPPQAAVPSAQ